METLKRQSRNRERESQKKSQVTEVPVVQRVLRVYQGTTKVSNITQRSSKAISEKGLTEFDK